MASNFRTIKKAVRLCIDSRVTPFIWGHRGIGKSSLVAQLAAENEMGCVDFRLSQVEASDIRGLPDRQYKTTTIGGVEQQIGHTVFLPPSEMPQGTMKWEEYVKMIEKAEKSDYMRITTISQPLLEKGILFLDETNRAQDDVTQAIFQLVLDRKIGGYVLPDGWSVVCAGNYNDGYLVNGFKDAALTSRFCHLQLNGGDGMMEDVVKYMTTNHPGGIGDKIINFASSNLDFMFGKVKGSFDIEVTPSPRSWDMVGRVMKSYEANPSLYGEDALTAVIAGLVGVEVGIAFRTYDCPVKPQELATSVQSCVPRLSSLKRYQLQSLVWSFAVIIKEIGSKWDKDNAAHEKQALHIANQAADFAEFLISGHKGHTADVDLGIAFVYNIIQSDDVKKQKIRAIALGNQHLAKVFERIKRDDESNGRPSKNSPIMRILMQREKLKGYVNALADGKMPSEFKNTIDVNNNV